MHAAFLYCRLCHLFFSQPVWARGQDVTLLTLLWCQSCVGAPEEDKRKKDWQRPAHVETVNSRYEGLVCPLASLSRPLTGWLARQTGSVLSVSLRPLLVRGTSVLEKWIQLNFFAQPGLCLAWLAGRRSADQGSSLDSNYFISDLVGLECSATA